MTDLWKRICESLDSETAPEIARKLGLSKQSVYEWQKGKMPSLEMLIKISESGNVSLDWLILGKLDIKSRDSRSTAPELVDQDLDNRVRAIVHDELARAFQQFAQAQSAQTLINNASNFRITNSR
jgi:transcriptional regulator with XRE-family HTH domain